MANLAYTLVLSILVVCAVNGLEHCTNNVDGKEYNAGESFPMVCSICLCQEDGIECKACGVQAFGPDYRCYYYTEDANALYPACCERVICEGDDNWDESYYEASQNRVKRMFPHISI